MTKFKVGDKVRVLVDRANCANVKKGDVFTVVEVDGDGIRTDGTGWYLYFKNIELIEPSETIRREGYVYTRSHKVPPKWEWGMWAMDGNKKVFVMSDVDGGGYLFISHRDFEDGFECVHHTKLTQITD